MLGTVREMTCPRYAQASLAEVLPSVLAALGASGEDNLLGLPVRTSYVVFLVDGLGWNLLLEHPDDAPYLSSLIPTGRAITSAVPSTTATSLTTLGTGVPPGSHGVVGFTSRIPGTSRLLDALRWDSEVNPREWQSHDTVFDRARAAGVDAGVVSKRAFRGSGLTEASLRGAAFIGADTVGERIFAAVGHASAPGSMTYVYEGELDYTGHRMGCTSWAWNHQLAMVDSFASRLREALPSTTVLLVTADHGMVDVAPADRLDVDDEPDLLEGVSLVGGEARFRHLYCHGGAVDAVARRWRERLGVDAQVVTRQEGVEHGWFGAVEPAVRPRLGDVMVASMGDVAVVSTSRFPHEARLVGLHGSLTSDEMLVPLLVDTGRG